MGSSGGGTRPASGWDPGWSEHLAPPRARLPRTLRREQLLQAAREVFVAQGFHGTAMDDIAERAGISKPLLYQHFPSKLELYLALLEEQIDRLIQRIRTVLSTTTENETRVTGAVGAYFDFVDSEGESFRLLFESDLRNDPVVHERVHDFVTACVTEIAAAIALETGTSPARAQLLSAGLTGLAEMSARWWLDHRGSMPRADAVAMMAGLAWRGISSVPLTAPRPPPPAVSTQPSAMSTQPSAVSTQPSAMSTQPSAMSTQPSAMSTRPSAMPTA